MNRQEKEKFITEKSKEINNIFVEIIKNKVSYKEFAKAKKKFMDIQNELVTRYVSELEDVLNPSNDLVKVTLAAALTIVLNLIQQDMTITDKKMLDVLCFTNVAQIEAVEEEKQCKD